MENLTAYLLSFMINAAPPGTTQYSLEVLPQCGTNKDSPTCELAPVCEGGGILCKAPFWADSKGAWVRFESPEAAARRYELIADVIVDEARRALFCEGFFNVASGDGAVCVPQQWGSQGDTEAENGYRLTSLVGMSIAVAIPESYLREDVQTGRGRSRPDHSGNVDYGEGRGPGNEAGFWQPHPTSAWAFMGYAERPKHDYLAVLVGEGRGPLERAASLFYREITHIRQYCGGVPVLKGSLSEIQRIRWAYRAISMYGTGTSCDSWNGGKTMARYRLYERFMSRVAMNGQPY